MTSKVGCHVTEQKGICFLAVLTRTKLKCLPWMKLTIFGLVSYGDMLEYDLYENSHSQNKSYDYDSIPEPCLFGTTELRIEPSFVTPRTPTRVVVQGNNRDRQYDQTSVLQRT